MSRPELDRAVVEDRNSDPELDDEFGLIKHDTEDLPEDAFDLGSLGEGRLAPALLMMLGAGLAVVVAMFSSVSLVTWLAAGVAVLFGVFTTRALRESGA